MPDDSDPAMMSSTIFAPMSRLKLALLTCSVALFISCHRQTVTATQQRLDTRLAEPLDQRAAKPVQTIRSEIKRGDEAVSLALRKLDQDFERLDRLPSLLDLRDTFKALINDNRAKNTDTDAFLLGAYYEYWITLSIHAKAYKENTDNLARAAVQTSYDTFREKQAALGLDDAALAEALIGVRVEPPYDSNFIQQLSNPFSILDK